MSEVQKKPESMPQAIKLKPLARWVLGIVGGAGMGGGSAAVFTQDGEAGPVAMIGIGAFFFLMCVVGMMPTRVKVGDNEAEWQAVQDYVEATVEEAPLGERPEALRALLELAKKAPHATGSAMEAVLFEQTIAEMLREIAHDVRPQVTTESYLNHSAPFDLILTGPRGRKALVEIKFRASRTHAWYEHIYQRYAGVKEKWGASALLLVTPDPIHPPARKLMTEHPDFIVVQVAGYEDRDVLRQAVEGVVGPLQPD